MEYGNYYTEETLRSLNAAYDTLYGITSRETEKAYELLEEKYLCHEWTFKR